MEDKDNLKHEDVECEKQLEDVDDLIFKNEIVKTHSER